MHFHPFCWTEQASTMNIIKGLHELYDGKLLKYYRFDAEARSAEAGDICEVRGARGGSAP